MSEFTHAICHWVVGGGVMKGGAEELHEGGPELRCEGRAMVGGDVFWHTKVTNPSRQKS